MTIRAVGYTRVSSQAQASPEKTSLERQAEKIQLQAQMKEWELVRVYEEPGISGATMDRPALQELIADAHQGKFQAVIVWDISRFGRNLLNLKQNTEELKKLGITFLAIDNGIDTSRQDKTGDLLLNILASIYEFELETIKARTAAGRLAKTQKRELFNGQTPYGYRKAKDENGKVKIIQVDEEVDVLRKIFDWYVNGIDGIPLPMQAISTKLNELGYLTVKGKKWSSTHISNILSRETYWTGKILTNTEAGDPIEFDCPKILTKKEWDDIRARAATAKKRTGPANRNERFILDGLLRCGICGGKVRGKTYQKTHRFYACYWHECGKKERKANGRNKCPLPRLNAEIAEKFVFGHIVGELLWGLGDTNLQDTNTQNRNTTFKPRDWEKQEEPIQRRITQLKQELKTTQTLLENLKNMLQSKVFEEEDFEDFKRQRSAARLQKNQFQIELREKEAELQKIAELKNHEQKLFDFTRGNQGILHAIDKKLWSLPDQAKSEIIRGCLLDGVLRVGPLEKEGVPFRFDRVENAIFGNWRLNPKILQKYLFDKTGISDEDIHEGEKLGQYWGESLSQPEDSEKDDSPVDFDGNAPTVDGKLTLEELINSKKETKNRKKSSLKSVNPSPRNS